MLFCCCNHTWLCLLVIIHMTWKTRKQSNLLNVSDLDSVPEAGAVPPDSEESVALRASCAFSLSCCRLNLSASHWDARFALSPSILSNYWRSKQWTQGEKKINKGGRWGRSTSIKQKGTQVDKNLPGLAKHMYIERTNHAKTMIKYNWAIVRNYLYGYLYFTWSENEECVTKAQKS